MPEQVSTHQLAICARSDTINSSSQMQAFMYLEKWFDL